MFHVKRGPWEAASVTKDETAKGGEVQDREVEQGEVDPEQGQRGGEAPPMTPTVARQIFGDRWTTAEQFTAILADTGVSHGLIGPREVPRLWERHVLNCAVVEGAFGQGSRVVDVGSGAGLPGLALAIARPDLSVVCVEPLLRRTAWLDAAVMDLGLDNVEVIRARAEDAGNLGADHTTARAVARLDKLARWCLPLTRPGGSLVALKGSSAEQELTETTNALRRAGMTRARVEQFGGGVLEQPTTVVIITR